MTMEDFNVQDMARVKYVREQVWLLKMVKLLILCHIKKNFSFKGASELHVGNFLAELPVVWTTETWFGQVLILNNPK